MDAQQTTTTDQMMAANELAKDALTNELMKLKTITLQRGYQPGVQNTTGTTDITDMVPGTISDSDDDEDMKYVDGSKKRKLTESDESPEAKRKRMDKNKRQKESRAAKKDRDKEMMRDNVELKKKCKMLEEEKEQLVEKVSRFESFFADLRNFESNQNVSEDGHVDQSWNNYFDTPQ